MTILPDQQLRLTGLEKEPTEQDPMAVKCLYIHPVKGVQGLATDRLELSSEGVVAREDETQVLAHDFCFVRIKVEQIETLGQKQNPYLATLSLRVAPEGIYLVQDGEEFLIPPAEEFDTAIQAKMFKDEPLINLQLLSEDNLSLQRLIERVFPGKTGILLARADHAVNSERIKDSDKLGVRYPVPRTSDGEWLHLANFASLGELNIRVNEEGFPYQATVAHFRPQVLINGDPEKPFDELSWRRIALVRDGRQVATFLCKPCKRCAYIMTDQERGEVTMQVIMTSVRNLGQEEDYPLRRNGLVAFEDVTKHPYFGIYLVPVGNIESLEIEAGDQFEVLERWE